ncbi:hypothetical protein FRC01_010252, partial [Tulasnella sp. 417]
QPTNVITPRIPVPTAAAHPTEPADKPGVSTTSPTPPVNSSPVLSSSVPVQTQQMAAPRGKSTGPSKRRKPLSVIKTTLEVIEAASKPVPVAGPFLEAAAK